MRRLHPQPGTAPPADGVSKLRPVADLQRLAAHIGPAVEGDTAQQRRAVAVALRVGLAHAAPADVGLLAAVVGERITELDDVALAGLYGAAHRETHRRAEALRVLSLPGGGG